VGAFPWGDDFARRLTEAGFATAQSRPLTLGVVYLYTARKG
jgi:ubiquinone/menaquinone biosynthesis C-methylase UbiE